jgi:hypothetical protein
LRPSCVPRRRLDGYRLVAGRVDMRCLCAPLRRNTRRGHAPSDVR